MNHPIGPPWQQSGEGRRLATAPSIRVETFHLMARREALQDLCDSWLNELLPPSVAVFRPAAPLVVCGKVFYPSMADRFAFATGHQSQTEVYFAIPVERWRVDGEREVFVEYGLVMPWMFVDNAESAVEGRERLGFPKEICAFTRDFDPTQWTTAQSSWSMSAWDPSPGGVALRPLVSLVSPSTPGGRARPGIEASFWPRDPASTFWTFRQVLAEVQAHLENLRKIGPLGIAEKLLAVARDGLELKVFNFRQFPHPEYDAVASYQDLVRFTVRINDVHELTRLAAPYQLLLRRSDTRPINLLLGLRNTNVAEHIGIDGFDAAQAVAPFVGSVDMDLIGVNRLCWRQTTGDWKLDDGTALDPPTDAAPRWSDALGPPMGQTFLAEHPGTRALDAKVLLFPIAADAAAAYLEQCIPAGFPGRILPMGSDGQAALRMLASKARLVDAPNTQELVWLDGSYVSLSIPVEVELDGSSFKALFLLGDFTDNAFMLLALRQLALSATHMAKIGSSGASWFTSSHAEVPVLKVEAQALVPGEDNTTVIMRPVVDIWTRERASAAPASGPTHKTIDVLWEFCAALQPFISVGSILRPGVQADALSHRIVLTDIEDYKEYPESRRATDHVEHLVVFHTTDTFSFFDQLALGPLDSKTGWTFAANMDGRCRAATSARSMELVISVDVRRVKILWESGDLSAEAEP